MCFTLPKMWFPVTDLYKAGLTGSAWRTNVLKDAGAAGILGSCCLEQGLPRQYAAQMIYNTLDVNRVKWSEDSKPLLTT